MKKNALLIKARWILTVNPDFEVLQDHALLIAEDKIEKILSPEQLSVDDFDDIEQLDLTDHVLMPGLINAHCHAAMSLFRGMADDLPLMDWLNDHIWPAEGQFVNHEFIRSGVSLAAAEMLRSGTTCFNDMYFYPEIAAQTAQQCGIRSVAGLIVLDFPTMMAQNADEYLHLAMQNLDQIKEYPLVTAALAPHAPYTVSDQPLEKIAMYSNELDMPVHMHIHETAFEVSEAVKNSGKRPLERLDQLGLLNSNLLAVHMTELDEMEITRLAETAVNVAHCAESNLKLASGFCPVDQLLERQINVCLGTDGAASNNDLDMFGEMKTAALLAKGVGQNASSCNARQAIEMATINGAKSLGLADKIGSLEIGKQADLIAVDLSALNTQPVYDPVSQLVYAANSQQVSHVWVNGESRLFDGAFTQLDSRKIVADAVQWAEKIQSKSDD